MRPSFNFIEIFNISELIFRTYLFFHTKLRVNVCAYMYMYKAKRLSWNSGKPHGAKCAQWENPQEEFSPSDSPWERAFQLKGRFNSRAVLTQGLCAVYSFLFVPFKGSHSTVYSSCLSSWQSPSILGQKIEMEIARLVIANPDLLRLGIAFEIAGARVRVHEHLQRNNDKLRQKRKGGDAAADPADDSSK